MLTAITVTSYMVNGLRLFKVVVFSDGGTLTWTVWVMAGGLCVDGSSIRCSSKERNEVTLIAKLVMVSELATGIDQETLRDFSVKASTSTFCGGLGKSSENQIT